MTTILNSCVGLVAQPSLRNREEMRTGGPHHVSKIIPLCLARLAFKVKEGGHQHQNNGKEECALC